MLRECLELAQPLERFDAELPDAIGCVLAESGAINIDIPVADMAACDGYAVRAEDTLGVVAGNAKRLRVTHEIFADSVESFSHVEGTAVRIASGARGADAVVPLWSTDRALRTSVLSRKLMWATMCAAAGNLGAGDVILEAGTRLSARHIALLASAGWGRDRGASGSSRGGHEYRKRAGCSRPRGTLRQGV